MSINSGFLLIDKPSGPTSHDVIDELRRITGIRKIGHAGTLDPFASGLLIIAVGREATKNISRFVKQDKVYLAKLHLGAISDTYDKTGNIQESGMMNQELGSKEIEKILKEFEGKQKQIPPMFSAKKVGGKKLYELARKGEEIVREPVDIDIEYIKILDYKWPYLKIETRVSSGTYIRALAYDIGKKLGCGAYLEELERTSIGDYNLTRANELKKITRDNWEKCLFQK
ncbi:MAG: tRNA pseudouridine(55) synthase TruB [Parcubacteria group bacterium CG10_big_fil_rev_8_21_14_0_10_36_14]|nr:MAG: tRNA pseudouridine(55) synthase TruB [Parcubacteria group bacterium CG10_big_fil_rev_8_21_14_0_10_36_14]